ncbi:hypothetical protein EVAR_36913_1 [Eumeta japonica]|uniref:Uncharacterized protein n=1 Tax=Eumeta variegata TaxID=151549 RepID=A0A4C1X3Z7_EUMVA|nr:hypothetical protein EVAR_36913_1 [Eumeta japonica]
MYRHHYTNSQTTRPRLLSVRLLLIQTLADRARPSQTISRDPGRRSRGQHQASVLISSLIGLHASTNIYKRRATGEGGRRRRAPGADWPPAPGRRVDPPMHILIALALAINL